MVHEFNGSDARLRDARPLGLVGARASSAPQQLLSADYFGNADAIR